MKKAQIYRRLRTLLTSLRDYFVEEEPRDKVRRTMKDASSSLSRIIYQRMALEYEQRSGHLDEEAQAWCDESLKQLRESERLMTDRLVLLRDDYRKLMLQDLFYQAINNPGGEAIEQAQAALMELEASVESERALRSMPELLQQAKLDNGHQP